MAIPSIKNRDLIRSTLLELEKLPSFSEKHLNLLTQSQYCEKQFQFKSGIAVLMELPEGISGQSVRELCYDGRGKGRFYVEPITLYGKSYLVTNYWYRIDRKNVRNNITPFLKWAEGFAK